MCVHPTPDSTLDPFCFAATCRNMTPQDTGDPSHPPTHLPLRPPFCLQIGSISARAVWQPDGWCDTHEPLCHPIIAPFSAPALPHCPSSSALRMLGNTACWCTGALQLLPGQRFNGLIHFKCLEGAHLKGWELLISKKKMLIWVHASSQVAERISSTSRRCCWINHVPCQSPDWQWQRYKYCKVCCHLSKREKTKLVCAKTIQPSVETVWGRTMWSNEETIVEPQHAAHCKL